MRSCEYTSITHRVAVEVRQTRQSSDMGADVGDPSGKESTVVRASEASRCNLRATVVDERRGAVRAARGRSTRAGRGGRALLVVVASGEVVRCLYITAHVRVSL